MKISNKLNMLHSAHRMVEIKLKMKFHKILGHNVVVLLNENAALANQVVIRDTTTNRSWTIPVGPSSIVTAVWKKNGKI